MQHGGARGVCMSFSALLNIMSVRILEAVRGYTACARLPFVIETA